MSELEYLLKFPRTEILFNDTTVTFSINYIKSRLPSILYFKLHCFDKHGNTDDAEPIYTYVSSRWVIDTTYKRRSATFDIPSEVRDNTVFTQIELVAIGITSENPLYFLGCMLNEGEDIGYHTPHENVIMEVGLLNSRYVNLYNIDGEGYLQVIRPQGDNIFTNKLPASTCTVLAPHFSDDVNMDDPITVFLEFLNQTEQRIDVLR